VRPSPAPRAVVLASLLTLLAAAGAVDVHLRAERTDRYGGQARIRVVRDDGQAPVRWVRVGADNEVTALKRWNAGVGPPFVEPRPSATDTDQSVPVIVSWNTHVGAGDVDTLVADLRSGKLTGRPARSFVLLLQEAYRSGADVPSKRNDGYSWASAQRPARAVGEREDIVMITRRLKLAAFYAPSMRNGEPGITAEDRGNAILSTLPLSDLTAIELPLERQRRVALGVTITVTPPGGGAAMPLRLVCTHFTNMVLHHLFVLSESGRLRQARSLAKVLPADGPLIVGGDFNAWFGYRDAAFKEMARVVPPAAADDRRATFGPMRLDHVLARLPQGWRASVKRADSRYGSDHYPLIAVIEAR
jgi:endonuclease/exonuclease/phosphatase family metal-dependent hydrolase